MVSTLGMPHSGVPKGMRVNDEVEMEDVRARIEDDDAPRGGSVA